MINNRNFNIKFNYYKSKNKFYYLLMSDFLFETNYLDIIYT